MLQRYSLALAIENFLPLFLLTFGLLVLARMLKRKNEIVGELSYIGSILIIAGHLLPAIAKLINAINGGDHGWLMNSLLVLSAPGFVCLAWALWRGLREDADKISGGQVWLLPLTLNAGLLALSAGIKLVRGSQAWFKLLLIIVTVAGIAAFVQLARRAIHHRLMIAAGLFLVSLLLSLALNWQSAETSPTESAEWVKQISNTIAQAAFMSASYYLSKKEVTTQALELTRNERHQ